MLSTITPKPFNLSALAALCVFTLIGNQAFAESGAAEADTVKARIEQALMAFDFGRIADAEALAHSILSESPELTSEQKHIMYQLLAFCAVARNDAETAVTRFVLALHEDPEMKPDPVMWSPKITRSFNIAHDKYLEEVAVEKRRRFAIEAQIGRQASLRSLYLPGLGQIMKGKPKTGVAVGLLCLGATAYSIYSLVELPKVRDLYLTADNPELAAKRWREYRDAQYMVNITGAIALAAYGYSFFDALWARPTNEVDLDEKPDEPPEEVITE